MNIHEYQAKKILSRYGVFVPRGKIAYTPNEAKNAAVHVSMRGPWMLKAQIQSGAREKGYFMEETAGKGGGIRLVKRRREILKEAEQMLGSTLKTIQTGPQGKTVGRIYVEVFTKVKKKFYAGLVIDRVSPSLTLLICELGEQDIMTVAIENPAKILKLKLDLEKGARKTQIEEVRRYLDLPERSFKYLKNLIDGMHSAFVDNDATMIEINPAGVTRRGRIIALDTKMSFDDNALFRHPDIAILQDESESEEREIKAAKYGFKYSDFEDGSIGCIVNGDGIALAAMDLIRESGMDTACFLNVKGGVDKDKIAAGIKIIMTNPKVEGILINILGGFLRCNLLAEGIVAAASEVGLNVPLVVRFEGTNKEEAYEILRNSKLPVIIAHDMEDSVDKLITAVKECD